MNLHTFSKHCMFMCFVQMIVVLKQDMKHNVVKVRWISVCLPVPLAPVTQCAFREETAVKISSVCKHCVWDVCIHS